MQKSGPIVQRRCVVEMVETQKNEGSLASLGTLQIFLNHGCQISYSFDDEGGEVWYQVAKRVVKVPLVYL